MSDEDIEIDEELVEDPEIEALAEDKSMSVNLDSRRRLEERLEEARLRKLMQDYDFD